MMADYFDKEYRTSALDIIHRYDSDLTGKVALVTGCTSGIGVETARALAVAHCSVYISGRNETALLKVRDDLNAELKKAGQAESVRAIVCDLSELSSVRAAAAEFQRQSPHALHLLVLNAGLMAIDYRLSKEGVDMQMAVNHVGHFLLFQLLTPQLLQSTPSRVVVVSSLAHSWGSPRIDYSRLPSVPKSKYNDWGAYQQSKLANVFFAMEIHRRYASKGLTAYSLNPGGIKTGLQDEMKSWAFQFIMWALAFSMKTIPQGAATSVYCAVAPRLEEHSGQYFNNLHLTDQVSKLKVAEDEPAKLWEWTEKFIAEH